MAAVYSGKQSRLRINTENISSDNENNSSQENSADSLSCGSVLSVKYSGVEQANKAGSTAAKAREHAEVAALDTAVPPIRIKEEPLEDAEYLTVHVDDVVEENWRQEGEGTHYSGRDDGDWPICCEEKNTLIGNKESYLDHRREHTHDGPIVCLDADSEWDNLLVSTDGGHQTLCCALCGCKFSNSREFFTHQLKHRDDLIKQESVLDTGEGLSKQKVFECNECGKTYSSIGQCLNHQRSHKQASKSVFHQLAHLKKKSFQCPTCGRSYSRASALDAHRRCHEEKLFKSKNSDGEKCPAEEVAIKTEDAADTSSEQLDESPKKLFECLDCGKSFRTMCGLGTHQRFSINCSNTTVKVRAKRSFDCTECGKTFDRPMAMVCHQRWHKRREQLHNNEQPFQCKECGRAFTSLTFYNKHQRLAHTNEMPAKSFLHQVIQLQKKAFECKECGRRFSRASALHSHQLCHTDAFSDIIEGSSQKPSTEQTIVSYQNNQDKNPFAEAAVYSLNTSVSVQELKHDERLNTEGSEAENVHKPALIEVSGYRRHDQGFQRNSDLELLCESDQEEKDPCKETALSSQTEDPQINISVVQVDSANLNEGLETVDMDQSPSQEFRKYKCADCGRTFDKAGSLRCHMLWHRGGMGKKSRYRRKIHIANPIRRALIKCDICGHESFTKASHYIHLGKHEDRKPYKSITYQLANLQKNSLKCDECGMHFSRLSALQSHQQHHNTVKKPYECLQCDKRYSNLRTFHKHQEACVGRKPHSDKEKKTERFNPSKTLLGPKVHHCKKCGKGFWSIGAFIHHKQYHPQCSDAGSRNSGPSLKPESGHVRRKGRGRKGVILSRRSQKYPDVSNRIKSKLYKCDICDKSYRVIGCFLKHKLIHQSQATQPPVKSFDYQVKQLRKNMYSCPDCGKLFSRAMALQFHMRSHGYETGLSVEQKHLSERRQCPNCHAFFNCEASLEIHLKHCIKAKEEKVEKRQVVEVNKLSAAEDQKAQKRSHEDERDSFTSEIKYPCDECDRSFSVIGALYFHKRIHHTASGSMSEHVNMSPSRPQETTGGAPFYCTECGRKFSTNSALGTHRRWHKDKKLARFILKSSKMSRKTIENGPFLCHLCGKGFFYLCVLRRHQKYHPPIKQSLTRSEPELKAETSDVLNCASPNSSLACPDCDESFITGSLLAAHFASQHAKPLEAKQQELEPSHSVQVSDQAVVPVVSPPTVASLASRENKQKLKNHCYQCNRIFVNARALRAHIWQKHRRTKGRSQAKRKRILKPFLCSHCGKRYISPRSLQKHQRSCDTNGERLKQPHKPDMVEEQPLQHRPPETGAKCLFKCQKCGKVFTSEKQLDSHKEAAKSRPHCCALCCRSYWTESQLQQHLIWHDEIRPRLPTELRYRLNSSVSGAGSSTKFQVSSTNPAKSPAKLPSTATLLQVNRKYSCNQCCKMFLSAHALEQHQTLHKGEEPYHCSLCPKTFAEIKDLIDHHQECLGDKELSATGLPASSEDTESLTCIECGISFSQEADLHQHYIDHARGAF